MYSMHHRNSAAWGREAEEKREREREEKKKTNNKREKQNKKEEEKMKKKSMKERREEKKMRKERGYVGILNTLLPLYSSGGLNLGNLVLTGWRGLTKGGLVPRFRWVGLPGEGAGQPPAPAPPLSSGPLGPVQRGRAGPSRKKGGEAPTFFPPQTTAGSIKSMTGGG